MWKEFWIVKMQNIYLLVSEYHYVLRLLTTPETLTFYYSSLPKNVLNETVLTDIKRTIRKHIKIIKHVYRK